MKFLAGPLLRKAQAHPEYQVEMSRLEQSYKIEESLIEEAPWIGNTGLPEPIERELPKYLRRELGELVIDDSSLKAKDLTYVGSFREGDLLVHYWRVPYGTEQDVYAYVEVDSGGQFCTGWGDRKLPQGTSAL